MSAVTSIKEERTTSEETVSDQGNVSRIEIKDARPVYRASEYSIWDSAYKRRNYLVESLQRQLEKRGVMGWIRTSQHGEYPLYILVEIWLPTDAKIAPVSSSTESAIKVPYPAPGGPQESTKLGLQVTERSSLRINMRVEPYRENPLIYSVTLDGKRETLKEERWSLSEHDLDQMVDALTGSAIKPDFFKPQVPFALRFLGAFFPFIGREPENKILEYARKNWLTLPWLLVVISLVIFVVCASMLLDNIPVFDVVFPAAIAVGLLTIASMVSSRRPNFVVVPEQSPRTPRDEYLLDTWHVCVPEAGAEFDSFKNRLTDAISDMDDLTEIRGELHQNIGPRGFEERERTVLTKGQANVHLHIYQSGQDAFVGWDGYLNWAKWGESHSAIENVRNGAAVTYRSLEPTTHIPTKFDLIDFNTLTEICHRKLVREIRAFLEEKEIEEELDFQIIRGNREKALERDDQTNKKQSFTKQNISNKNSR